MPVPWFVPIVASAAGSALSAGAAGRQASQDRAQRQREAEMQAREDDRNRLFDQRNYNDRLGSAAMSNPMKMAMLQKLAAKRGMNMAGMGLPDVSKYRAPVPYDFREEEMMDKERQTARDPRAELERLSGQLKGGGIKQFKATAQSPQWQEEMRRAAAAAKGYDPAVNQRPLSTVDLMRRRMGG